MQPTKYRHLLLLFAAVRTVLLVAGGVKGLVSGDSRFGRGMFHEQVDYTISYFWIVGDQKFETYTPPVDELRGRAESRLAPGEKHTTRYGFGTLKCRVDAYVDHIATKDSIYRPRTARGAGAVVTYRINKQGAQQIYTINKLSDVE